MLAASSAGLSALVLDSDLVLVLVLVLDLVLDLPLRGRRGSGRVEDEDEDEKGREGFPKIRGHSPCKALALSLYLGVLNRAGG